MNSGSANQNRHIAGGRYGNCHCDTAGFSASVYSFECREREGVPTGMLRKQDLLQNIRQKHGRSIAAAWQS